VEAARGGRQTFRKFLSQHNLTVQDVRDYLQWQESLLKFIELRFRPAVQVTAEDVEKYYRETVLPQAGSKGRAPELNEVHDQLEEKLTGERVDQQMNDWIKRSRGRTAIRFVDPALGTDSAAPVG
jgi:hypothetical protein